MIWEHILGTVLVILLFVVVLGYFLDRITRQLRSITATLAKITFGVRAVETQCAVIGPAVDRINDNLAQVADGLGAAAMAAESLGNGTGGAGRRGRGSPVR